MEEMTSPGTVTEVATNIGQLITAAMDWMGDVLTTVSTNPILFTLVVALPLVGVGIGLVKRLISL